MIADQKVIRGARKSRWNIPGLFWAQIRADKIGSGFIFCRDLILSGRNVSGRDLRRSYARLLACC